MSQKVLTKKGDVGIADLELLVEQLKKKKP